MGAQVEISEIDLRTTTHRRHFTFNEHTHIINNLSCNRCRAHNK